MLIPVFSSEDCAGSGVEQNEGTDQIRQQVYDET